jgi:Domain of unknown function (DUF4760)
MKPHNNLNHRNHNIFGELSFKITFDIFVISLVVSFIATIVHALIPNDYKNTLTFAATTFATSVGGLGAFYAYRNLSQSANSKLVDRTLLYLQRWNEAQYIPLREASLKIFEQIRKQSPELQARFLIEYFETNPADKQKIITILNFLTEMALCIEEGFVDEKILKKYFKTIVQDYCEDLHEFINQRRGNGHGKDVYKALIDLYEKWRVLT